MFRNKQKDSEDLADLKRLGTEAREIWDQSSERILDELPNIPNIVLVQVQITADARELTIRLVDIDGVACTFWCPLRAKTLPAEGNIDQLTLAVRAISTY